MRSALSQKVAEGKLFVVDAFDFDAPRTKRAVAVMGAFEAPKALFVDKTDRPVESDASQKPIHNTNLRLSVRNLPKAKYLAAEGLNVEDILGHDVLFISREAIAQVEEALQ